MMEDFCSFGHWGRLSVSFVFSVLHALTSVSGKYGTLKYWKFEDYFVLWNLFLFVYLFSKLIYQLVN